jgi:hypothetical protein
MSFASRVRVGSESRSLHVAALASIAIAQPLFDLLGGAPEFLLAHDLGPSEILALVALVGIGMPLAYATVVTALGYVHVRAARVAAIIMISVFLALVTLYAVRNIAAPPPVLVAMSAISGILGAVAYHRSATARTFATWLSLGIAVAPVVFVARPGVRSLLWPQEQTILESSNSATPVVLVVFDGLPLSALLDEHQQIDRDLYPSFAALADESAWYRNATTVADYTRWAVPAILSGKYPRARSLPIASDHPQTIFTLLGSSHAVKVHEPISRLCPQSVCDHGGEGIAHELVDFADTLSLAYLHGVLPAQVRASLPPIDQGWAEGIPPSDTAGEVWLRAGDHSRRGEALAFINAIEPDTRQPSLLVMHVLLPHTPLAYLPGGQRYGTERYLPGLLEGGRDRWQSDPWAVTQGYRRYLLQIASVDTLVGQLVKRLKDTGIYDRALLVVTADHGASFRPGRPFRRVTPETAAEILPVPLLIKRPHQRGAVTSDRNVETVDILPTIADIIGVHVPWQLDGVSAAGTAAPKAHKTVYYDNARRVRTFPPTLMEGMRIVVDHKARLFGTHGNAYRIPRNSPQRALIGRAVDDLTVADAVDDIELAVDLHGDFSHVEPGSRFLPAHIAGRARWLNERDEPAVIAAAVNGVIVGTTRTYSFEDRGSANTWSLLMPADAFRRGDNDVDLFVVDGREEPILYRTHFTHTRPVDLLSNAAAYGLRVTQKGLYEREGRGETSFRWTKGRATITVPYGAGPRPRSIRVNLATAGPIGKDLSVRVNDCEIFSGKVPAERWSRIFAWPSCKEEDAGAVIELRSSTHAADDRRELGVAVERIDLLEQRWPPSASPLREADRRSQIRLPGISDDQIVESTVRVTAAVANRGAAIWAPPADLGQELGAIRLGVLWFPKGRTTSPAAVQRVELPRPLVPGDTVEVTFQLAPVAGDGTRLPPGEYEAWIGMMQEGVGWFYASGDSVRKLRVIHDSRA